MSERDKVNILLVDDQPAKLLSYEVILQELGENLIKATSAREALEHLLKNEIAVVLVDVVMPELDGFQLAAMIREHPRFRETAMIFISAVQLADIDRVRGYEMGAVDYVPVPVVPEVLRAKVRIFTELFRKARQLETLNRELEKRVKERTAALERSNERLLESERRRSIALAAGKMGSWTWDLAQGVCTIDEGQYNIFGLEPGPSTLSAEEVGAGLRSLVDPEDREALDAAFQTLSAKGGTHQAEFRVRCPSGEVRWCLASATADVDEKGKVERIGGVTLDITERKRAEETQVLLAREVDHRARNALAVVQSILRMTHATSLEGYTTAVEGRIRALARAHGLLSQSRWQGADLARLVSEEVAPFKTSSQRALSFSGPSLSLEPATAQTLALVLHELATNAVKHGALASDGGKLAISWKKENGLITLTWSETGLSGIMPPKTTGFGTKVIGVSVREQLRGKLTLNWRPEGLLCIVEIPDHAPTSEIPDVMLPVRSNAKTTAREPMRILLVEDEALVALMMQDLLKEAGHEVVGPYGTVSDAMHALNSNALDGAILDINLSGGSVYPAAEALSEAGVPFVFVTGYDAASIDERYKDVPILQKPIERQQLTNLFVDARRGARRFAGNGAAREEPTFKKREDDERRPSTAPITPL